MSERTNTQNRAMHLYFRLLAEELNTSGQEMRAVMEKMKEGVEIPWNSETVKEVLWRRIQQAQTGKDSTTELDTKEVSQIYETLNRFTAERLGVSVPFPEIEHVLNEQEGKAFARQVAEDLRMKQAN